MATKINYEVIDQMFAAVLSANESEATIKALRPQVEEAVQALIEERGLPKNYTGTIEYHGFKIVVRRPKSYTWEKNNSIQDANLDFYKRSTAPSADEMLARTRFAVVGAAVAERKSNLSLVNSDKQAFLAQKDEPGGKKTMKAYLWKVCGDQYDQEHPRS